MPTYEYVCTECGEPLEVVASIHDPALTECPACRGRLRKVFGNVGVVFKGSGFYRTDSRGKSSAATPAAKKADGDSGPSSSSATTGSSTTSSSGTGSSTSGAGTSAGSSGSGSASKAPAAPGP